MKLFCKVVDFISLEKKHNKYVRLYCEEITGFSVDYYRARHLKHKEHDNNSVSTTDVTLIRYLELHSITMYAMLQHL